MIKWTLRGITLIFATAVSMVSWPAEAGGVREPVGISLWWQEGEVRLEDGTPRLVTLYGDERRYLEEIDITEKVTTTEDRGIQPLLEGGDFSRLDWTGVQMVDEDWRPDPATGTFTRSRFYRGAAWMSDFSSFALVPVDDAGDPVGPALLGIVGDDERARFLDAFVIRRFGARQITYGCVAVGDCTGATRFDAQALVQFRQAERPRLMARSIPRTATRLALYWSEDPGPPRYVDIEHANYADTPYRYGFDIEIEVLDPPADGQSYQPGEVLRIRSTYTDGVGTPLHPAGTLPTYGAFLRDEIDSGLRYYDGFQELLTLYYALKHREGLTMVSLGGPTDRLGLSRSAVAFGDLFLPAATTATVANDGFSGTFTLVPPTAQQAVPELIDAPVSDTIEVAVPLDALPGTYVIASKARRDWGGQAKNALRSIEIPVGQPQPTTFQPVTGNCETCHSQRASLDRILHGGGDRRTCYACHPSLEFEPDHSLDYRIHLVHSRSNKVGADVYDCSTCHLQPPMGPPRGFPGIGPE